MYGHLTPTIGYVNILTMSGYSLVGNDEQVVRRAFDSILTVISKNALFTLENQIKEYSDLDDFLLFDRIWVAL